MLKKHFLSTLLKTTPLTIMIPLNAMLRAIHTDSVGGSQLCQRVGTAKCERCSASVNSCSVKGWWSWAVFMERKGPPEEALDIGASSAVRGRERMGFSRDWTRERPTVKQDCQQTI